MVVTGSAARPYIYRVSTVDTHIDTHIGHLVSLERFMVIGVGRATLLLLATCAHCSDVCAAMGLTDTVPLLAAASFCFENVNCRVNILTSEIEI